MADQFVFAVAGLKAAAVCIADQAGGVEDQDHALRGVEDFLVEVALALQLRLKGSLFGDVQHQAANLDDLSVGVADGGDVLQGYAAACHPCGAGSLRSCGERRVRTGRGRSAPGCGDGIEVRAYVGAQEFVAGTVAEHAHHGVVDVEKAAVGRGEEQAFLNAVEEFAIAALGFAAIGHILQNVDGARVVVGNAGGSGGGDQKDTFRRGHDIFFARFAGCRGRRGREVAARLGNLPEAAHGFPDQGYRRHAEVRSQGAIGAHDTANERSWTTM